MIVRLQHHHEKWELLLLFQRLALLIFGDCLMEERCLLAVGVAATLGPQLLTTPPGDPPSETTFCAAQTPTFSSANPPSTDDAIVPLDVADDAFDETTLFVTVQTFDQYVASHTQEIGFVAELFSTGPYYAAAGAAYSIILKLFENPNLQHVKPHNVRRFVEAEG